MNSSLDRIAILGELHVALLYIKDNLYLFFTQSIIHTFIEYIFYSVSYSVLGFAAVDKKYTVFVVINRQKQLDPGLLGGSAS